MSSAHLPIRVMKSCGLNARDTSCFVFETIICRMNVFKCFRTREGYKICDTRIILYHLKCPIMKLDKETYKDYWEIMLWRDRSWIPWVHTNIIKSILRTTNHMILSIQLFHDKHSIYQSLIIIRYRFSEHFSVR